MVGSPAMATMVQVLLAVHGVSRGGRGNGGGHKARAKLHDAAMA